MTMSTRRSRANWRAVLMAMALLVSSHAEAQQQLVPQPPPVQPEQDSELAVQVIKQFGPNLAKDKKKGGR